MRKKSILFVVIMVILLFPGCGGKPEAALVGKWKMVQRDGTVAWFVFSSDNTLNVNNEIWMGYSVTNDKKLILGEEEPVPYSIKNETLTIKQEHLILTLTRQK